MKKITTNIKDITKLSDEFKKLSTEYSDFREKAAAKKSEQIKKFNEASKAIQKMLKENARGQLKKFLLNKQKPVSFMATFDTNLQYLAFIIFSVFRNEDDAKDAMHTQFLLKPELYILMKDNIEKISRVFKLTHRYYKKSEISHHGCVKFYLKKK